MSDSDKYSLEGVRHDLMAVIAAIKTANALVKNEPVKESIKDLLVMSSQRLAEIVLKIDKSKN